MEHIQLHGQDYVVEQLAARLTQDDYFQSEQATACE